MHNVGLLRDAAYAIAAGERATARGLLRRLDAPRDGRPAVGGDDALDTAAVIAVLDRDGWRCAYCERLVLHPFVLDLVSRLEPVLLPSGAGPLPPHPALPRLTGVAAHALPSGLGPDADMVAACRSCEAGRRESAAGSAGMPAPVRAPVPGWDGLTHLVVPLFEVWQAEAAERGEQRAVLTGSQREWLRLARGVPHAA